MFRVGRDLWGSSGPTPLPKQGHLEQAAQDLVQAGLEYLQRRIHSLPGQPVPVLCHLQREEVLPRTRYLLVGTMKELFANFNAETRSFIILISPSQSGILG